MKSIAMFDLNHLAKCRYTLLSGFFVIAIVTPLSIKFFSVLMAVHWAALCANTTSFGLLVWIVIKKLKNKNFDLIYRLGAGNQRWTIVALLFSVPMALLGIGASLVTLNFVELVIPSMYHVYANILFDGDVFRRSGIYIFFAITTFVVIVPVAEEIFFRGFFLSAMLRKFSLPLSLLISCIGFAILHSEFIAHMVYALFFSALALKARTLFPSIVAHTIVNSSAFLLPAVFPNLQTGDGAILLLNEHAEFIYIATFSLFVIMVLVLFSLFNSKPDAGPRGSTLQGSRY